jgi:hypothetical protein
MNAHLRSVYLRELARQCEFALFAIGRLNAALQSLGQPNSQAAQTEVFRSLHSFLAHASNASRILWPPSARRRKGESDGIFKMRRARTEERGRTLRNTVGLDDGTPLKDRTLRDHLEHFDERIAEWDETSERKNYVQDTIGPPNAIVGIDPGDAMRWYDPTTNHYLFRGERFDMQALASAIDRLKPIADVAAEAARREGIPPGATK